MKQEMDKKVMFVIMIMAIILVPVYKLITNKDNKIEEKSAINEIRKNKLAMYVEDGDTYREYKGGDKFPEGYKLNIEKSKCVDNKGNEITPIDNVLSHDGMKVTVKSNKTIYCTLYFDEVPSPDDFIYYIKSNSSPKYTNKETNTVYIKHEMEEIESYCITEEETSENCTWVKTEGSKDIQIPYTFTNEENEEKSVKVYLKDAYEDISHPKEDKIIFDNVAPVINTLTVANVNSRQYKGTISAVTEETSGIDQYYLSNTGSSYTNGTVNNATYSGTKGKSGTVYAYVTDKAGNIGAAVNKSVTIGGTGTSEDPYHIYYIEDLVDLSNNVNGGTTYANQYFVLDRSLDFKVTGSYENSTRTNYGDINRVSGTQGLLTELTTGQGFKPIGYGTYADATKSFRGIFDGKKFTLSNLYENNTLDEGARLGLFGITVSATIKNLTVTGTINTTKIGDIGGIAGVSQGTTVIDTCVNNAKITSSIGSWHIGGIIGGATAASGNVTVKNSTNKGAISGGNNTGGIIGFTDGTLTITNCTNSGVISNSVGANVGGILGRDNADTNVTNITNSSNTGGINGKYSGGIMGFSHGKLTFNNCHNSGTISTSINPSYSGGIIGVLDGDRTIVNKITSSYNTATVKGTYRVGGLIGLLEGTTLTIDKSYNTGEITGTASSVVGGLIGHTWNDSNTHAAVILNSYNTGNVISNATGSNVGGLVGCLDGSTINAFTSYTAIANSYNAGNVTGSNASSGINGISSGNVIDNNVYNIGIISGAGSKCGLSCRVTSIYIGTFTNCYYDNSVTSSNAGAIGTGMILANMKLQAFVNTLNTNKNSFVFGGGLDSRLNGYTLCNWKLGTKGYPELSC